MHELYNTGGKRGEVGALQQHANGIAAGILGDGAAQLAVDHQNLEHARAAAVAGVETQRAALAVVELLAAGCGKAQQVQVVGGGLLLLAAVRADAAHEALAHDAAQAG